MNIAVACDHRGFEAKKKLIPLLKKLGHEVQDFGCDSTAAVDYPEFAIRGVKGRGQRIARHGRASGRKRHRHVGGGK